MAHNFHDIRFALTSIIAVLTFAVETPTWAVGSITTTPAPTPATPTPVITDTPPLTTVGAGGCVRQYREEFNRLNKLKLDAETAAVTSEGIATAVEITAAIANEVAQTAAAVEFGIMGGFLVADIPAVGTATPAGAPAFALAATSGAEAVATAAEITGLASRTAAVISEGVAVARSGDWDKLNVYVVELPECNREFTGTVTVSGGGVDVTGNSIFNNDVGVAGDVNVQDDVNASQLHATQGISAVGGGIWIGDPNGTTYSEGITLGGGALSGAGVGGAQAFTGDAEAIAIGNNASAMLSGSLALGIDASSTAADAIAIGRSVNVNGFEDVAIGASNNTGAGGNNTVIGNEIDIIGAASANNTVLGVGHQVTGSGNFVGGDPITIVGSNNVATGNNGNITGDSNVAIGDTVNVTGNRAVAVGDNSIANGDDATAIGANAQANATGSAAIGQGAVATQTQQQVLGTAANTYTTPGITSSLSSARQTGPLSVATTDAAGNLATDGGQIFDTLSENQAGIAIAMAMANPSLTANESFGIAVHWGRFERSQGLAVAAMGVINKNVFGGGERLSLDGSLGVSLTEKSFGGRTTDHVGSGRVGVQLTW